MPVTTIMIVEAHPLFRKGLTSLIAGHSMYSVIGEVSNTTDALELLRKKKPALVIMELNLGNDDGFSLIKDIKIREPDIVVLVLSMFDERYYSERALHAGARGYIMKNKPGETVLDAIKTVMSGKVYLSEAERERFFESMTGDTIKEGKNWFASVRKLSDRQFQIFTMIGKGLGTIEISSQLSLSAKTIDTHKEHIKLKLHCNSSQELRQLAIEWSSHSASL